MCAHVGVGACAYGYVCMWSQMAMSGVFLHYSLPYSLRENLSLNLVHTSLIKTPWPAPPPVSACFNMGAGDPNPGHLACTVSAFLVRHLFSLYLFRVIGGHEVESSHIAQPDLNSLCSRR